MKEISIKDLENIIMHSGRYNKEAILAADILLDFYYNEDEPVHKKDAEEMLEMYNDALKKVATFLDTVPYYDGDALINNLLSTEQFPSSVTEIFPIAVYISSGPQDKDTVGILIHMNGKKELFEGNDEASNETYQLVNKLLGTQKKRIKIWGMHNENLVSKIKQSGYLPLGLYVSPDRQYAGGHYDLEKGDRVLFSGIIDEGSVRKESDVDWRIMEKTKIEQVRIY